MCDENAPSTTSCCNADDDGSDKASSVTEVRNSKAPGVLQYENEQEDVSSTGSGDTSEYGLNLSPSSSSDHSPVASTVLH
jgi:hypothetical protein